MENVSTVKTTKRNRCTKKKGVKIIIGSIEEKYLKAKQGQAERLKLINQSLK